jgi:hypothetical protein
MANKKEIIRDHFITIKVSKEEKELWEKFSEEMGINKTRLARNTLMKEAESIVNKYLSKPVIKAYIRYAELTKNTEILERIKKD